MFLTNSITEDKEQRSRDFVCCFRSSSQVPIFGVLTLQNFAAECYSVYSHICWLEPQESHSLLDSSTRPFNFNLFFKRYNLELEVADDVNLEVLLECPGRNQNF